MPNGDADDRAAQEHAGDVVRNRNPETCQDEPKILPIVLAAPAPGRCGTNRPGSGTRGTPSSTDKQEDRMNRITIGEQRFQATHSPTVPLPAT